MDAFDVVYMGIGIAAILIGAVFVVRPDATIRFLGRRFPRGVLGVRAKTRGALRVQGFVVIVTGGILVAIGVGLASR